LGNVFTVARLLPLGFLIVLRIWHFGGPFQMIPLSEISSPSGEAWLNALLLLLFAYGGAESAQAK
jgi:amino acid transporter